MVGKLVYGALSFIVCSMIHGLRIKDGKASYVSRYVRTSRLKQEDTFGGAKFVKVTSKQQKSMSTNLHTFFCLYYIDFL